MKLLRTRFHLAQMAALSLMGANLLSASTAWSASRGIAEREKAEGRETRAGKVAEQQRERDEKVADKRVAQRLNVKTSELAQFIDPSQMSATEISARAEIYGIVAQKDIPSDPAQRTKMRLAKAYVRMVLSSPDSKPPMSGADLLRMMEKSTEELEAMIATLDLTTSSTRNYYATLNSRQTEEGKFILPSAPTNVLAQAFASAQGADRVVAGGVPFKPAIQKAMAAVVRINEVFNEMNARGYAPRELLDVIQNSLLAQIPVSILDDGANPVATALNMNSFPVRTVATQLSRRNGIQVFFPFGLNDIAYARGEIAAGRLNADPAEISNADLFVALASVDFVRIPEDIGAQIKKLVETYSAEEPGVVVSIPELMSRARRYIAAVTLKRVSARPGTGLVATQRDLEKIAPVFTLVGPNADLVDKIVRRHIDRLGQIQHEVLDYAVQDQKEFRDNLERVANSPLMNDHNAP